jgi:predicted DNA-binding transcriptional regulator YafY
VPIEREAGVGYLLRKGSDIPPLMLLRSQPRSAGCSTTRMLASGSPA